MADVENILVDSGEEADTPEEVSPTDEFKAEVKKLTAEYLGYEPNALVIQLAVEQFAAIRNYPATYTDEMKLVDMEKNLAKIAMAVMPRTVLKDRPLTGNRAIAELTVSTLWLTVM